MARKKRNKGPKPKQRYNTPPAKVRKMDRDPEDPTEGNKDPTISRWRFSLYPTKIIDWIGSSIIWLQLLFYQKIAGRMPLFLKSKTDDQEQEIEKHKAIIDELKTRMSAVTKKMVNLSDEMSQCKLERNMLNDQKQKIEEENQRLKENKETILNQKEMLRDSYDKECIMSKQLQDEIATLKKANDKEIYRNNQLETEIAEQDRCIQKLRVYINDLESKINQASSDIRYLETTIDSKEYKIQELLRNTDRLVEENRILQGEKQDALRRLSEQVSYKLRDNNPNIVDLSDPCRATKLAEMFGELYDNEWTNAFSILEATFTEEQAIVVLLDTVMLAYMFCEQRVDEPWECLVHWFLDENLPGAQQTSKWLKDSRKVNIQNKVPEIEKMFTVNMSRVCYNEKLKSLLSNEDISTYITKCIEVCLLMVTTDPPVVLVCPGWKIIQFQGLLSKDIDEDDGLIRKHEKDESLLPVGKHDYDNEVQDKKQTTEQEHKLMDPKEQNECKQKENEENRSFGEHDLTDEMTDAERKEKSNFSNENNERSISEQAQQNEENYVVNYTEVNSFQDKKNGQDKLQGSQRYEDYDDKLKNAVDPPSVHECKLKTNSYNTGARRNESAREENKDIKVFEQDNKTQEFLPSNIDNSHWFDEENDIKIKKEEEQTESMDEYIDDEKNKVSYQEELKPTINQLPVNERKPENDSYHPATRENDKSFDEGSAILGFTQNERDAYVNGKKNKDTVVNNLPFDKDLFREYTSRGKFQEYVVWPAMRLHKNGSLLSKGVAQGCKNKTKTKIDKGWTWIRRS